MAKSRNNKNKKILGAYKKDSLGLFDGGYKQQVFATEIEKEANRRKNTQDWLKYAEQEEMIDDCEDLE